MAERVQRVRQGETAGNQFIGLSGEITVDTTNSVSRVHDGVTPGGFPQARGDLANSPDATIGSAGRMPAAKVAQLDDHETRLDLIETTGAPGLQAQIDTNTTSIGVNATAINVNETDINVNETDIAALQSGQNQFLVATGSSTAYVVAPSPAPGVLVAGYTVFWRPNVVCGDAPTLDVGVGGAKALLTRDGISVVASMLQPVNTIVSIYDGVQFIIPELSSGFFDLDAAVGVGGYTVTSKNASSLTGPEVVIDRNRGSQVSLQDIGQVRYNARSSVGTLRTYVRIKARVLSSTNGDENGSFNIIVVANGSEAERLFIDNNEVVVTNVPFEVRGGGDLIVDGGDIVADLGRNIRILTGTNDPEGAVLADRGSLYLRSGATSTNNILYMKQTNGVTTGWQRVQPV